MTIMKRLQRKLNPEERLKHSQEYNRKDFNKLKKKNANAFKAKLIYIANLNGMYYPHMNKEDQKKTRKFMKEAAKVVRKQNRKKLGLRSISRRS